MKIASHRVFPGVPLMCPKKKQDVPVAPSEQTEALATSSNVAARRVAVYLVATAALLLVVWSLIKGGDRNLWTQPSALLQPVIATLVP